jgi:hypothetical protein
MFTLNKRGKGGRYSYCKDCHNRRGRDRYKGVEGQLLAKADKLKKYWPHLTRWEAVKEYDALFQAQNGLCAVCGNPETEKDSKYNKTKDLNVDHDHVTNNVRGLLCGCCNRGLGQLKDNPVICEKAAEYLKRPQKSSKVK